MKMIFLWATCLVVITGCNAPQENHDQIENGGTKIENTSENSNFYGTYEGTLPAADCEGIKTTLTLNKDKTYILRSEYIGEGEKSATFESKGHYNLINGNLIELSLTSSNEKSYYKILDGSKLMLSDKEGSINQGILSEHYILKKK